ncbi:hypothetical protein [Rhodococcus wratislaviensis]|uniref:hypothetical protein n=1 Tax=Rhodococcus wratislaviensis TaxID=44752 RepID=UPI003512E85D
MTAAPWTTEQVDGKVRFSNATGSKAVAITIQGLGTDFNDAVPHPIDNGEHFDLKLDGGARVYRIFWLTTEPNRQYQWDYTR